MSLLKNKREDSCTVLRLHQKKMGSKNVIEEVYEGLRGTVAIAKDVLVFGRKKMLRQHPSGEEGIKDCLQHSQLTSLQ